MVRNLEAGSGLMQRLGARLSYSLLLLLMIASPHCARADYVLQTGDVLEFAVSGAPALNRRVAVSTDGKIPFPLLGEVQSAGLTLTELKQRLQDLLAAKNVIKHPDLIVTVAEYGPIYLSGDVAKPGEYRFRPEMTVRDAIALAGGFDTLHNQARLSPAEISQARGEYGAASIEYARQRARTARVKAELADSETFEINDAIEPLRDQAKMSEILSIEISQLKANREEAAREKAYLERIVVATRDQVVGLEQAESQQQLAFDQQSQSAARTRELVQQGVVTAARADDYQRAAAQLQGQLFEIRAQLAQARKELEERLRQRERFDDQRQTKLLEALREAVTEAGKARYRMEAARDQMEGGAAIRQSSLVASVTIRRVVKGDLVGIAGTLDATLQSGDSIEVVGETASPYGALAASLTSIAPEAHVSGGQPKNDPRRGAQP
jgi:polysaccharide export outer membrane protein